MLAVNLISGITPANAGEGIQLWGNKYTKEELKEVSSSWASKRTGTKAMIDWRCSVADAREKFSKFYHNP